MDYYTSRAKKAEKTGWVPRWIWREDTPSINALITAIENDTRTEEVFVRQAHEVKEIL